MLGADGQSIRSLHSLIFKKESTMKKFTPLSVVLVGLFVCGLVWAGIDIKISRLTSGIAAVGYGATGSNTRTLVVSDQSTNEVQIVSGLATVTGALTVSTNSFTDTFVSTPRAIIGVPSGNTNSMLGVVATVSTSKLIVTGLSTNAITGINDVPYIIIGNRRNGAISQ